MFNVIIKRIWPFLGCAMFILTGCALENNPTGPSLVSDEAIIAASQQRLPTVEHINFNAISLATTDNLVITFDKAMDPSTLSVLSVLLYRMADGDNTVEERLTEYSIVASNDNKTITITPTTPWINDRFYRIKICNTVQSIYGKALDGNGNGLAEGVLDDYENKFKVGNPSGTDYDFTPLQFTHVYLEHGIGNDKKEENLINNHTGNIVSAEPVKLSVIFNRNLDKNSIFDSADTLHSNVTFIDDKLNANVGPNLVEVFDNSITATFNVQPNTLYKFNFKGGSGGVRSSTEAGQVLPNGRYLDNGVNNIPEEDENVFRYFLTQSAVYASSELPTVESVTYFGLEGQEGGPDVRGIPDDERRFRIMFNVPGGSRILDELTLTRDSFIIYGEYPSESGNTFKIDPLKVECVCTEGYNVADVYLPDSIYPNKNNAIIRVRLVVHPRVATTDGLALDTSGDGVGDFTNDYYYDQYRTIYAEKQTGGVF